MKKIAFSGRQSSGKTYLAQKESYKYCFGDSIIFKLADPVYVIAKYFYACLGWDWDKDRRLLQFIGTNLGRKIYGKNIWVSNLFYRIGQVIKKPTSVILQAILVDDVRFYNELKALQKNGFKVYRVIGKHGKRTHIWHWSELALMPYEWIDRIWFKLFKKTIFFDGLIYNKKEN